ncbi:hypothetical protein U728_1127 [Clostridium botulinum 202F]|nr:hypothetical protein U728_1127 [Clostridium botulinum 202F]KAI3344406.1 hypothetical protein CIT17_17460 [Clostridium botulinum]KON13576.1 hypothetical protein ACP50_05790 [Clostridium botulinum]MBY6987115.1 hypothetical protein [Clostridium botulinum]NFH02197.1 hypothetical protein [Clostridium botulinum]
MNKDFNDFLATITMDDFDQISESVNNANIKIGNPAKDVNAMTLPNGIATVNFIMTIQLLGRYHDWLNS